MTEYQDLLAHASQLPVDDRLRLIDDLASSVPDDRPPFWLPLTSPLLQSLKTQNGFSALMNVIKLAVSPSFHSKSCIATNQTVLLSLLLHMPNDVQGIGVIGSPRSPNVVFTHGPLAHLRTLATGGGDGTISRNSSSTSRCGPVT